MTKATTGRTVQRTCPTCHHLVTSPTGSHLCTLPGPALTRWREAWKPLGEMPAEGAPGCPGFAARVTQQSNGG